MLLHNQADWYTLLLKLISNISPNLDKDEIFIFKYKPLTRELFCYPKSCYLILQDITTRNNFFDLKMAEKNCEYTMQLYISHDPDAMLKIYDSINNINDYLIKALED